MKIGFVTDLHYRRAVPGTSRNIRRECRLAGEALDRILEALAVEAIDVVVCAGDCVDDATQPGALDDVATLAARFAASGLRCIILPGNHDPAPDVFYSIVPRPPRILRLGDCDLISFGDDAYAPGEERCARSPESLALMTDLLATNPPEVALTFLIQHYLTHPPHTGPGYNHTYANDAALRAIMERSPRRLAVLSGHQHRGHEITIHNGVTYFTGRALCERPFPYYILHADGGSFRVEERAAESLSESLHRMDVALPPDGAGTPVAVPTAPTMSAPSGTGN